MTCPHCGAPVTEQEKTKTLSEIGSDLVDSLKTTVQSALGTASQSSPAAPTTSPKAEVSAKNRFVAGILGVLLGAWGIHNFYLGRIGRGVVQILICWTGISWIWGLIEGLLCLTGNYKDGKGKPLA